MKITFSGLTREVERENGTIDDKECHALFYNKAIYRFIYEITDKAKVNLLLSDFKAMTFDNCDYEETDGGENNSIRFFNSEQEIEPAEEAAVKFLGDGIQERISLDYNYDWLHSIALENDENQIFLETANFNDFMSAEKGQEILEQLSKIH